MKKFITIYVLSICFLTSGMISGPAAHASAVPLPQIFHEIAGSLSNPESIAKFMWKNFIIESDQNQFGQEERWQSPDELLKNQRGDCEDFARFAYEILRLNGTKAWLVSIYGRGGYGHTICVFFENGRYHAIDGTEVKRFKASSLSDVFGKIYPFWKKAALVKAMPDSGRAIVLKEFRRA